MTKIDHVNIIDNRSIRGGLINEISIGTLINTQ